MENILEINGLTKDFRPSLSFTKLAKLDFTHLPPVRALEDISFSLERGKILGILGPNGAGKTTLLKTIATLILPNKGTIIYTPLFRNKNIDTGIQSIQWSFNSINDSFLEEKVKSSLGLVLEEERSFYHRLTGRQNLEFFASLYGFNRKTIQTKIEELFSLFQIDYGDKRFDLYSTGMKKRVALIRSLIHNPELLLLDEPTKSLDYLTAVNLKKFIKEKLVNTAGKTVIFTTHNLDENLDFCDLFLILNKGKICAYGTLSQLRQRINNPSATIGEVFIKLTREL